MPTPDLSLPLVFGRADAVRAGLSPQQVGRRVTGRGWDRLRRGAFTGSTLDPHMRRRADVLAAVRAHHRTLPLSHEHAARAWGLPQPLSFVSDRPPVRRRGEMRITVAPLLAAEIVAHGAVHVSSPARTVVDCARTLPGPDALAIADAALRQALVTLAELQEVRDRISGWPGVQQARRTLALADGRRETPLESWSAWAFDVWGLPPPCWQAVVCDADGVFLGRADAWWRVGVAGEADGRVKYRLAALERGGVDADGLARALDDERRREAGLRRAGVLIVRWSARDVLNPATDAGLAQHIRVQLELAAGLAQFTGRVLAV
jgi:hypothetical protein